MVGFIIYTIVSFFAFAKKWEDLGMLFFAFPVIVMFGGLGRGDLSEAINNINVYYPDERKIELDGKWFFFKRLEKKGVKKLPKEIYYFNVIGFFSYLISVPVLYLACSHLSETGQVRLLIFVGVIYLLSEYAHQIPMTGVMFFKKFKKLTSKNLEYWFLYNDKWDAPITSFGECKVLELKKKRFKTYATVERNETGEVIKDVYVDLTEEELKNQRKKIRLFEICGVKYIK